MRQPPLFELLFAYFLFLKLAVEGQGAPGVLDEPWEGDEEERVEEVHSRVIHYALAQEIEGISRMLRLLVVIHHDLLIDLVEEYLAVAELPEPSHEHDYWGEAQGF